jgi:hypothetical protein
MDRWSVGAMSHWIGGVVRIDRRGDALGAMRCPAVRSGLTHAMPSRDVLDGAKRFVPRRTEWWVVSGVGVVVVLGGV